MDPLWIGGISLVVLILVLVFAYLLFYKEQTFEDALASQANTDILIQSKQTGTKGNVKHRNKKPKKERTRSEGESEKIIKQDEVQLEASDNSDPSTLPKSLADEAAMLFEATPEKSIVAESSEEEKPASKLKKRVKYKRRAVHHRGAVEDPQPKEQEPVPVKREVLIEETLVKTSADQALEGLPSMADDELLFSQEVPGNSGKKPKKSKASKDKQSTAELLDPKLLMDAVEKANLNHNEIQNLVDVLLDKQKSADQWKKSGGKPDPMDVLKKQLNDKETAYKEEHSRAESLAIKIKEQRDEHVQAITKHRNNETAAAQRIKTLEKENEALQMRMTASHQNNALEHEKLLAALENSKKTQAQNDWSKLQEELTSAKEYIQRSENQKAELDARILALETDINSRKENEDMLTQKAVEANDRVKNFDAVKNSLSQQLMETVKSKSESEQRLEMAKKDAETAHAEKSNAIQKAGELQSQLDQEISKKSELEKMFKALELKLKDTSEKHVQEKEVLVRQLESASEKKDETQVVELQKQSDDASRQVDDLKKKLAQAEEDHGKTKQSLTSREEQLNKHEGEINDLKSLNSSKDEEIELLRKAVSEHENEIVVMKNNASQELQSAPPEVDDTKVKSLEEEIEKLTGQLNEKKEQIATWEKSIETMKTKNNELREKNWKAMDAMSSAEKQHKVEIGKAVASVKEENKKNLQDLHTDIKVFLCRIQPDLTIDQDLSYEDFLKKYESDTEELRCRSLHSESNDSKLGELEEELKKYRIQIEELTSQCVEYKTSIDSKENELKDVLQKNEEFDTQCNKYKSLLGSTENMLHELEQNVEKEIADLKVTVEKKDAEIEKTNSSLNQSKEKLEKALEDAKSKDEEIASLKEELSSKANLGDKEAELQKMTLTVTELKENLRKTDEDAKSKDAKINSLENDVSKANTSVTELKESLRKAGDESKSKESQINSLRLELSTLKKAAATSSDKSKNELKKLNEEIERLKEKEKGLRDELEAAKNEAKLRAEEDKSLELEKYKSEATDAAKVNAALRRELEEVRTQNGGGSKSPKKKEKENDTKIKALEEKLALAAKKESELQAKIAHLEDSASTASLDEDHASPDAKEKKKKKGFSLMGSKSSKYEAKYRDMTEKYEQVKSESDQKSSRISELEAKLQNSEKALETQEQKVKELKAQVGVVNGGVQNTSEPLNESQIKQMAEAMKTVIQPEPYDKV